MRTSQLLALLMLLASVTVLAEPNSSQRVKAFAKLPDWTGLWDIDGMEVNASGRGDFASDEARDRVNASFGLHLPYNAEWEIRYQAAVKKAAQAPDVTQCDFGFPALMMASPVSMFQANVLPEETTLVFGMREIRHIYTDGRPHTPKSDLWPTHWGDSIGHWEGQTLVVDTIATNASLWGPSGSPGRVIDILPLSEILSEQVHFIERIRMLSHDLIEDQITIDDPVALTRPWQFTQRFRRVMSINRMVVEDCIGNDRDPVVNGKFTVTAP